MAKITFHDNEANTVGNLPKVGEQIFDFELVAQDLSVKTLKDFEGKKKVFNFFPSVDTGVCAASVRKFNEEASSLENTVVINVSKDLPFALSRFCASEGLNNVINLSDFRTNYSDILGITLADTPLKGLMSRAVVVVDEENKILHTEQVSEITNEPNYETALQVFK